LTVIEGLTERHLKVEEGSISALGAVDTGGTMLTQVLLAQGLLDEHAVPEDLLAATTADSARALLLTFSELSEAAIDRAVRGQVKNIMLELFFADEGRFVFYDPGESSWQLDGIVWELPIAGGVAAMEVLMDGMRRFDEWRELRKAFPHDNVIIHALTFHADLPALKALAEQGEPLPLRDLCMRLRMPRFQVFEQLYEGLCRGLVAVEESSQKGATGRGRSHEETLLRAAQNLLVEKQFEEASTLLEGLRELNPLDPNVVQLLKRARSEHLVQLYSEMPADVRPIRTVNDSREHDLSAEERHMLSRVNGRYDVATLLAVTPLGELRSLRSLHRLHRLALIRFDR
jgi:hypothetical protein